MRSAVLEDFGPGAHLDAESRFGTRACSLAVDLWIGIALFVPTTALSQTRLVLDGATLIDAVADAPVSSSRVVIADGRIVCVSGPTGCLPAPGDSVMDLTGLWITPGLIDTHAHVANELPRTADRVRTHQALRFALGITTVRDAGGMKIEALLEEKALASAASYPFPRVVVAERPASPYDERYGVALGAPLVRRLAEMGVDAIKIKDHLPDDSLWIEEVRAARELGLPVFGHTWRSPPAEGLSTAAIQAGISGISHVMAFPPEAQPAGRPTGEVPEGDPGYWRWRKGLWLTAEASALEQLTSAMIDADVWLEPTLVMEYYWGTGVRPPPHLGFLRDIPPALRDILRGRDVLEEAVEPTFPEPWERMAAFVRDFHERGGMLVTGGDNIRPGLDVHAEMALLRRAGLSPLASLRAATRDAARALERHDLGTIERGKLGDAVVYDADPLGEPGNTLRIRYVIKGGHVYDAHELLRPFREDYARRERALWQARAERFLPWLFLLLACALGSWWLIRRGSLPVRPDDV